MVTRATSRGWLFHSRDGEVFGPYEIRTLNNQAIELIRQRILDKLEIEIVVPSQSNDEHLIVEQFSTAFLTTWRCLILHESLLMPIHKIVVNLWAGGLPEKKSYSAPLKKHWYVSEAMQTLILISFSLSLQNRRKSRMGHALQNHLAALFTAHNLRFESQAITEGKNKPDFLFPGATEYHNPAFPVTRLCMLAAKSSAKDRWRQILTEAARLPTKYLCTLEAGISTGQTAEMTSQGVRLVIPSALHITYTPAQQNTLLTLGAFVDFVRGIQS